MESWETTWALNISSSWAGYWSRNDLKHGEDLERIFNFDFCFIYFQQSFSFCRNVRISLKYIFYTMKYQIMSFFFNLGADIHIEISVSEISIRSQMIFVAEKVIIACIIYFCLFSNLNIDLQQGGQDFFPKRNIYNSQTRGGVKLEFVRNLFNSIRKFTIRLIRKGKKSSKNSIIFNSKFVRFERK